MKIDELIEELEQIQDRFGNIDLPWQPRITDGEELRPRPEGNNFYTITLDMDAHAVKIPKDD